MTASRTDPRLVRARKLHQFVKALEVALAIDGIGDDPAYPEYRFVSLVSGAAHELDRIATNAPFEVETERACRRGER